MKLRGKFGAETEYSIGDVVLNEADNLVYHLQKAAPVGTDPKNDLYWGKLGQDLTETVRMIMDIAEKIPTNISEDALLLKSSTEDSDKEFLVTVDDDGELTATEVE